MSHETNNGQEAAERQNEDCISDEEERLYRFLARQALSCQLIERTTDPAKAS